VLNEDIVLENCDLNAVVNLSDHHDTMNILATRKELGFAQDRRTSTTGLTTFAAALLLGF
jgi:hypothetical protein